MTKISYIAGAEPTERAQRAGNIQAAPFIPYLSMTKGEMTLALMLEQAQILAQYTGEQKYKDAEAMLRNALYKGVHGATPYLGAYNADLRGLVKVIDQARRKTAPASSDIVVPRTDMLRGVHVGEPIIPVTDRLTACREAAMKIKNFKDRTVALQRCARAAAIEKILNGGLEKCGQYLAYGYLPNNNNLPALAVNKIQNHKFAQADIGRVGKFGTELLQQWLNVGMMRQNAEVAKVGPLGWADTNAALTQLPEAGQKELLALFATFQKTRFGTTTPESEMGRKMAAIIAKYQQPGVSGAAVALAIIGAITALIGGISEFAKQLKKEQDDAFAQVNGFGDRFFGPENGDWDGKGVPVNQPGGSAGGISTPLLFSGALLAAVILFK